MLRTPFLLTYPLYEHLCSLLEFGEFARVQYLLQSHQLQVLLCLLVQLTLALGKLQGRRHHKQDHCCGQHQEPQKPLYAALQLVLQLGGVSKGGL